MAVKKYDLSKYTKAELIELVERVVRIADPFGGRYDILGEALIELGHKRSMRKLDEAEKHSKKANEARKRYIDIMEPYKGKKWSEIKLEVLEKARAALEEAQREEKEYLRLSREV